jgi:hypothetical protein
MEKDLGMEALTPSKNPDISSTGTGLASFEVALGAARVFHIVFKANTFYRTNIPFRNFF